MYLCTDTVISLYRGRFYARCAKNSSLYREYRYIGVLSHTFYCNFCRDITYLSLYREYRYIEDRCIRVPLYYFAWCAALWESWMLISWLEDVIGLSYAIFVHLDLSMSFCTSSLTFYQLYAELSSNISSMRRSVSSPDENRFPNTHWTLISFVFSLWIIMRSHFLRARLLVTFSPPRRSGILNSTS